MGTELYMQTDKISDAREKMGNKFSLKKIGIKRKPHFTPSPNVKKEKNSEIKRNSRLKMTEEQKTSIRNTDKFRKKLEYDNLPEEKKTRFPEDRRNFEKTKYDNLPEEQQTR